MPPNLDAKQLPDDAVGCGPEMAPLVNGGSVGNMEKFDLVWISIRPLVETV